MQILFRKLRRWKWIGKGICIMPLLLIQHCTLQPVDREPLQPAGEQAIPDYDRQNLTSRLCGFQEPLLQQWQEKALRDGNFDLAAARARLRQATALADQRQSFLLPRADLELSAVRLKEQSFSGTSGTGGFSGASSEIIAADTIFSGSLGASYEVDLWGRLRNQHKAALLEVEAADADIKTAEISVSAELAEAWFDFVAARINTQVLERQLQTSKNLLKLIRFRFRQGLAEGLDITQQQQQLESLVGEQAQVRAGADTARHRLRVLSGMAKDIGSRAAETFPRLLALPPEGVPVNILAGRPDLAAAWLRLRAIDYRTAAVVSDWLPDLVLSANISDQAAELADLFNELFWQLSAAISQSLYEGGRRDAVIRESRARAEEQLYRYGALYRQAIRELRDALVLENRRLQQIESLDEQYRLATVALELAREKYANGEVGYLRVLSALQAKQDLDRRLVNLQRQRLSDRIGLCRAMGATLSPAEEKSASGTY